MVRTIALLTDFGLDDNYVGVIKGVILKINPRLHIVDVGHLILPQDICQAALSLKSSYRYFPKKTIFLAIVDPGVGSKRRAIILQTPDYTFVAPDNGILSLAAECEPRFRITEITTTKYFLKPLSRTFHGRDIFAPTAAYLSLGMSPKKFGKPLTTLTRLKLPKPMINFKTRALTAEIIAIDRFGNLTTNIEEKDLHTLKNNFRIKINNRTIIGLADSYAQMKKHQPLGVINSAGYLEIAVNCGSAEKVLRAAKGTRLTVIF